MSLLPRVLLTGATGFLGSHLLEALLNKGHEVVILKRSSSNIYRIQNKIDNVISYDVDLQPLDLAFEEQEIDVVIHTAGRYGRDGCSITKIIESNVMFGVKLLDACQKYNIDTFINTDTLLQSCVDNYSLSKKHFSDWLKQCSDEVQIINLKLEHMYGIKDDKPITEKENCNPESFYGVAKLASEHYMRIYQQYGINSTSLRLFNVYGPGQNLDNLRQGMVSIFLAQMLHNRHIHVKGSPNRYRDFIHVHDVVDAFLECLDCKKSWGQRINVATGKRTTVGEVIDILCTIYDQDTSVEYSGSTDGDIHGIYADTSLMLSLFKMEKMITLEDGLRDMLAWISSRNQSNI